MFSSVSMAWSTFPSCAISTVPMTDLLRSAPVPANISLRHSMSSRVRSSSSIVLHGNQLDMCG